MTTKRSDKKRNESKVAKVILKNPTASEREIAKLAWVSAGTAHNHKTEIEQSWALSKDPRIRAISDKDLQIVNLVQNETLTRLQDEEQRRAINTLDLNRIGDMSIKRHSLIMWSATDDKWAMKENNLKYLTDDELVKLTQLTK